MGLLDGIKGAEVLDKINIQGIFKGVGSFVLLIATLAIVAGIVAMVLYLKKNKQLYKEKIHFFEEVQDQMIPVEDCVGAELIIPNTNIRVFYIKSKDLYMPRGVKKMGKNSYWYAIRNNREIVNFTMSNLNKVLKEAGLDFDHTDMRYAYANLREIIKRNYKDKSKKWWLEYKDVISVVIFVFVITVSMFFITRYIGSIVDKVGPLIDKIVEAMDRMIQFEQATGGGISSGVKPA